MADPLAALAGPDGEAGSGGHWLFTVLDRPDRQTLQHRETGGHRQPAAHPGAADTPAALWHAVGRVTSCASPPAAQRPSARGRALDKLSGSDVDERGWGARSPTSGAGTTCSATQRAARASSTTVILAKRRCAVRPSPAVRCARKRRRSPPRAAAASAFFLETACAAASARAWIGRDVRRLPWDGARSSSAACSQGGPLRRSSGPRCPPNPAHTLDRQARFQA